MKKNLSAAGGRSAKRSFSTKCGLSVITVLLLFAAVGCKSKEEPKPEDPAPHWKVTESVLVDAPQWKPASIDDAPYSMTVYSKKNIPGCRMASTDVISVISASGECLNTCKNKNVDMYLYVQKPSDDATTFRLNYYSTNGQCYYISKDAYDYVNDGQLGTVDNMLEPEWLCCGQYPYLEEIAIMIFGIEGLAEEDEIAVFSGDVCRTIGPATFLSNDAEVLQLSMFVPMEKVKESFDVRFYDSRTKTVYTASNVEIGYNHSGIGTAIFTRK